jgi:hypothetical protein
MRCIDETGRWAEGSDHCNFPQQDRGSACSFEKSGRGDRPALIGQRSMRRWPTTCQRGDGVRGNGERKTAPFPRDIPSGKRRRPSMRNGLRGTYGTATGRFSLLRRRWRGAPPSRDRRRRRAESRSSTYVSRPRPGPDDPRVGNRTQRAGAKRGGATSERGGRHLPPGPNPARDFSGIDVGPIRGLVEAVGRRGAGGGAGRRGLRRRRRVRPRSREGGPPRPWRVRRTR